MTVWRVRETQAGGGGGAAGAEEPGEGGEQQDGGAAESRVPASRGRGGGGGAGVHGGNLGSGRLGFVDAGEVIGELGEPRAKAVFEGAGEADGVAVGEAVFD